MKTCFFSVSFFKEAVVVYFEAFSCIPFIIVFRFVSTCHYLFSLHSDYKGVSESAGNGWYRNVPLLSASESSTFEFGQRATIWAPAGRNAETWLFWTFCRTVCDCSWISGTFWKRLRRNSDSLSSSVLPSRSISCHTKTPCFCLSEIRRMFKSSLDIRQTYHRSPKWYLFGPP